MEAPTRLSANRLRNIKRHLEKKKRGIYGYGQALLWLY
jgi:hypothetical protein